MSPRLHVVVVGQLPPPVSGFSHITERMVAVLGESHDVVVRDIAAGPSRRGLAKHLFRLRRTLAAAARLLADARHADRAAYVACEGDLGLVYTLAALIAARLGGYPIFLHHHSFSYIDRPRALMRMVLAAGGPDLTHVFLCSAMRDRFEAGYRRIVDAVILSNAAFVPPDAAPPAAAEATSAPLVLGHLSNLTREKGLYLFIDLVRAAIAEGLPVRAVLAGPIARADDRAVVEAAVAELAPHLDYRGSLYGAAKDQFYRDIDVFVFPSQYANEAQPTVLFEAQAAGNLVISFNRGCIANQVRAHGLVLEQQADFVAEATAWLRRAAADRGRLQAQRTLAWRDFAEEHRVARAVAATLLD